ncbi:MAG: hypothetical protein FWG83_08100 [Oscillospiraceae bacterium]|nr:hypothetical protein [Oscillospiraceae bacterium]
MKKKRHREILGLIKSENIINQEMLLERLRARGIVVTQATISRDIAELGLKKATSDDGIYCYVVPEQLKQTKFVGLFSHAVKTITVAMNTIVIKTYPGLASAVCTALDLRDLSTIVGTIAGDDTIFAMTRSERDAAELAAKLKKLL